MTLIFIIYLLILIVAVQNLVLEIKRDLMMMQQNSYRPERYRRWLKNSGDTTGWARLTAMCVFFLSLVSFTDARWAMGFILAFCGGNV